MEMTMAAKKMKLTAETPVGKFTRTTASNYSHVVVRTCERSMEAYEEYLKTGKNEDGVTGRWIKDRGFAVTWHSSSRAAQVAASKPYTWSNRTGPATVYSTDLRLQINIQIENMAPKNP